MSTTSPTPTPSSTPRGTSSPPARSGAFAAFSKKLLERVATSTFQDAPAEERAGQIEMLAADELRTLKEKDAGKAILAWFNAKYSSCKAARQTEEVVWLKNLDMFEGRQHTKFDRNQGAMRDIPNVAKKPRVTMNFIEPKIRTLLASVASSHPSATVAPASSDDDDIAAATAGQAIWEWYEDEMRFHTAIFNRANFDAAITGQGFIKTWFDLAAEDPAATAAAKRAQKEALAQREQQMAQQMAPDPMSPGMPAMSAPMLPPVPPAEPVYGRIRSQSVSPWHLYVPDLAEPDLQSQPYVFHAYTMTIDQAKMVYADYLPENHIPTSVNATDLLRLNQRVPGGENRARPDSTLIRELWVRPGVVSLFPKGGLVIAVDDEIVAMSKDGLPYDHGNFPFAHITGIETGRFYRRSLIRSLIPLQAEYNRIFSLLIEFKNLSVSGQYFYEEDSLDPRRVTNAPGQYIPVRLGNKFPQKIQMSEIPQFIPQLIDRLNAIIDDVAGQHPVSRAVAPGADTAASAIQILQERDDSFLSSTLSSVDAAFEDTARMVLSNAVQFWDEPRLIKVAGADESYAVKMLTKADVSGGTDIRMDPQSGLPTSKAGKIATITEWIKLGILDPQIGMQALEMGTLGKLKEWVYADRNQATRENLEMRELTPELIEQMRAEQAQSMMGAMGADPMADSAAADPMTEENPFAGLSDPGIGLEPSAQQQQIDEDPTATDPMADATNPAAPEPVVPPLFPINDWDNDAVHIEVHGRLLKSEGYQRLDPAVQEVIAEHWRAHNARASMVASQQAMMAAGPDAGAPGEESGPPSNV